MLIQRLQGGLIVSCQAPEDMPLGRPAVLAAMAEASVRGGAVGIRANLPQNIRAIRELVDVPIIGIYKHTSPNYPVYITPTFEHARAVVEAGAHIVAIDATARERPQPLPELIQRIREQLGVPVMADISTLEEGITAAEMGADLVATTLSGYTPYTQDRRALGADIALVAQLAQKISVPVICEGRIASPEDARLALQAGAWAVVVGTAITAIDQVTARFVQRMKQQVPHHRDSSDS
ncbi:MAG: N-acetylmannosamine-6-phosphate 2-epimerase [Armatimonadota bacterium]|nr:N-acetylmannosamine-6-phosphate 2-epimerase [bacterium]MDW8321738.1 N-acetylmannosamine-6-phosphate 2-epimerase [Armatimonadota bacterium]